MVEKWKCIVSNVIFIIIYFIVAQISFLLVFNNGAASVLWIPAGISVSSILLRGKTMLSGTFIGALSVNAVNLFSSEVNMASFFLASISIAVGNTLEAFVNYLLMKHLEFDNFSHSIKFVLSGMLGCLIPSIIGPISLALGNFLPWESIPLVSTTWWIGNYSGVLILTPIVLFLYQKKYIHLVKRLKGILEFAGLFIFSILLGLFMFGIFVEIDVSIIYFIFIPLLWGTFRFRLLGSTAAILSITFISVISTINNHGPFKTGNKDINLIIMQLFICILGITAIIFNAHVERQNITMKSLEENQVDLAHQIKERTQDLKREKDNAEKALKIKSNFLANMSHEIRTPMNGVLGMTQIMQTTKLSLKQKEYIRSIEMCGNHLLSIIDDILNLSSMEEGKFQINKTLFDIRECIDQAIELSYNRSPH